MIRVLSKEESEQRDVQTWKKLIRGSLIQFWTEKHDPLAATELNKQGYVGHTKHYAIVVNKLASVDTVKLLLLTENNIESILRKDPDPVYVYLPKSVMSCIGILNG